MIPTFNGKLYVEETINEIYHRCEETSPLSFLFVILRLRLKAFSDVPYEKLLKCTCLFGMSREKFPPLFSVVHFSRMKISTMDKVYMWVARYSNRFFHTLALSTLVTREIRLIPTIYYFYKVSVVRRLPKLPLFRKGMINYDRNYPFRIRVYPNPATTAVEFKIAKWIIRNVFR